MPDPTILAHPVDDLQLSAYYDGALEAEEDAFVAAHLARCSRCQSHLAGYARLTAALLDDPDPLPSIGLDQRVEELLVHGAHTGRSLGQVIRPFVWSPLAAAALFVIIFGALLFGQTVGKGPSSVAEAYPCDDVSVCAIQVHFDQPVDRAQVESSIQVDPPVPMTLTWQGDTLLVKPTHPLQPAQPYTVSVGVASSAVDGPPSSKTTVAVRVVAPAAGSPVSVAPVSPIPTTRPTRTAVPPTPVPPTPTAGPPTPTEPSPTAQPTAVPVAMPPRAATPTTTVPAIPAPACAVGPMRIALPAPVAPGLESKLGCVLAPETGVTVVVQPFERGRLIWRSDRHQIVVVLANGSWSVDPAPVEPATVAGPLPAANAPGRTFVKLLTDDAKLRSALGNPTGAETRMTGVIQSYAHGSVLSSGASGTLVLIDTGAWQGLTDPAEGAAPVPTTPSPTSTPSPAAVASGATITPTVTATAPPSSATVPSGALGTSTPVSSGTSTPAATPTATAVESPSPTPPEPTSSPPPDVPSPTATATPTAGPSITPSPTSSATASPTPCATIPLRAANAPTATPVDSLKAAACTPVGETLS